MKRGDRGGRPDEKAKRGVSPEREQGHSGASRDSLLWVIYREGVRFLFKLYFRAVHRIRVEGAENVPSRYERLIVIANHASLIDGILVWTYLKLPFKIIVDRTTAQKPLFRPFMQNRYTVQIDSMSPYGLKEVIRRVNEGTPLLIFPEGRMTLTGSLMKIYEGTGFAALRTGADMLPLYLGNTYETLYAKKHRGRRFFAPITLTIGKARGPISLTALPPRARKQEAARIIYRWLSEVRVEALNKPSTLGREFIRLCRTHGGKPLYKDATGRKATYRQAITGAFMLGRQSRSVSGQVYRRPAPQPYGHSRDLHGHAGLSQGPRLPQLCERASCARPCHGARRPQRRGHVPPVPRAHKALRAPYSPDGPSYSSRT